MVNSTTKHIATDTINALRLLANQMISQAGSGHPGITLGAAPILYELYANQLNLDPTKPDAINRDRFVLSAGHGSALLYATLHAAGFAVSAQDLSEFRQLHSNTPGHPEVGITPGVEATTGPLGQGLGMAVGMAMTEAKLHAQFPTVINHYTYALVGDGDLMEGVTHEVAALAGQQALNKLIVLYDDNDVSLDGDRKRSDTTDNVARFVSYGFDVQHVADGDDLNALHNAIEVAKQTDQPSLIAVKTVIGAFGPFAGTNKAHGTPLDAAQIATLANALQVEVNDFELAPELLADLRQRIQQRWQAQVQPTPSELAAYNKFTQVETVKLPELTAAIKQQAGRKISQHVIQEFAQQLPQLWGGAADLVASTNAVINDSPLYNAADRQGRNIAFGVREFGMGTVLNGIALHGGTKVFGATFLAFSDYMRAAIRLSAMQHAPVIYVFTHDSITVGEDGPTHQAVEQIMSLRLIPGVDVLRPGTPDEVAVAWQQALTATNRPMVLILSRGKLGDQGNPTQAQSALQNGATQIQTKPDAKVNLIATGSEVQIAMAVSEQLTVTTNVISMPDLQKFLTQSSAQRAAILPTDALNVVIEAGTSLGWQAITGLDGLIIGIDEFGLSAPPAIVQAEFGLTTEVITEKIMRRLAEK
ncbi:MAG: transketolase [Lactobacillaceae bacterium]|jgi:transketolase|nr:transketolase [Lactobacillaceae bacterium]